MAVFRSVTGLSLFRDLGELPEHDPLKHTLRRWVYRLAEQRINHQVLTELAEERKRDRPHADTPGRSAVSFATMLTRALSDAPRREVWVRVLLANAASVSDASVELWQRRRELARRMGLDAPALIEAPLPDTPALAAQLADATRDRVEELSFASPAAFFELAIGRDVPGSWPARLSPPRLMDYFRDGDLLRSLDLAPPPLPASWGASSLCRALGLLGGAWLEALAPRDQPFVVAHDPYGLMRHEAAALFALLPLNPRFLQKHLDIAPHALADVQQRLGRIWLLELAQIAFRVRLRAPALAGENGFREAFSELSHRDLCLSLPRAAAGAIFPLGVEDEQRLLGNLLAVRRAEQLRDVHDEDWFRNPRAIEQLRAEAQRPPPTQADPEAVTAALKLTSKNLETLLR